MLFDWNRLFRNRACVRRHSRTSESGWVNESSETLEARLLLFAGDPNDQISEATEVSVPQTISETISQVTDVDMYELDAAGLSQFSVSVRSNTPGFVPILRVFRMESGGSVIQVNNPGADPDDFSVNFPNSTFWIGVSEQANVFYSPTSGTPDIVTPSSRTGSYTLTLTGGGGNTIDLEAVRADGPSSSVSGATISVSTRVDNEGSASSGSYKVDYYLSTNATITASDRLLRTVTRSSISGGGTDSWSQSVTLPTDLTPGTYRVGIIVDRTDLISESADDNNTVADTGTITISAATIVVNSVLDTITNDGVTTLREAITFANDASNAGEQKIVFASALSGSTITLQSPLPAITDDLDITGLGADLLAISGMDAHGIFLIGTDVSLALSDIALRNAKTAINADRGNLSVDAVHFVNNTTGFLGTSIVDGRNVNITNSRFEGGGSHTVWSLDASESTHVIRDSFFDRGVVLSGGTIVDTEFAQSALLQFRGTVSMSGGTVAGTLLNRGTLSVTGTDFGDSGRIENGGNGGLSGNDPGTAIVTAAAFRNNNSFRPVITNAVNSSMTMSNVTFIDNSNTGTDPEDGGIIDNAGVLTVRDSTFSGNVSANDAGVIFNDGTLDITNSTFENNSAARFGGAILNVGSGDVTIRDSRFSHNSATEEGGALNNNSAESRMSLSGVLLEKNISDYGGGILNQGAFEIRNSTLTGNVAHLDGGAISNGGTSAATTRIVNSTVSSNRADRFGGALDLFSGRAFTSNATIYGNRADSNGDGEGAGGGVSLFVDNGVELTLHNTVVAGNHSGTQGDSEAADDVDGPVLSLSSFNVIGSDAGMTGLTGGVNGNIVGNAASPIDPRLGPLESTGGILQVHLPQPTSPLINAGDPEFDPSQFTPSLNVDQAGNTRVQLGRIDIGAIEASSVDPFGRFDLNQDGLVNTADLTAMRSQLLNKIANDLYVIPDRFDVNSDDAINTADLTAARGHLLTLLAQSQAARPASPLVNNLADVPVSDETELWSSFQMPPQLPPESVMSVTSESSLSAQSSETEMDFPENDETSGPVTKTPASTIDGALALAVEVLMESGASL